MEEKITINGLTIYEALNMLHKLGAMDKVSAFNLDTIEEILRKNDGSTLDDLTEAINEAVLINEEKEDLLDQVKCNEYGCSNCDTDPVDEFDADYDGPEDDTTIEKLPNTDDLAISEIIDVVIRKRLTDTGNKITTESTRVLLDLQKLQLIRINNGLERIEDLT